MTTRTKIEWTEATWNPVTGCTPISPGCVHCYARRMAKRLAGRCGYPAAPNEFSVTLHPDKLGEPLQWKKPRRVFVCSMSDLFHEDVPFEFIDRVFAVAAVSPQHTFQILTKRPHRMLDYLAESVALDNWAHQIEDVVLQEFGHVTFIEPPLPNVWLGATIENQEQADKRIPLLLQTPAAVRFVSVEPMLGPVNLSGMAGKYIDNFLVSLNVRFHDRNRDFRRPGLDWIICGGETGPGARPMHPDWVRSLRDQCQEASVPFFFKSWGDCAPDCLCGGKDACREIDRPEPGKPGVMFRCGKKASGRLLDGREWSEYPEEPKP